MDPGVAGWLLAGASAVLLAIVLVRLGARWTRARIGRDFNRRIGELYERILAKADAARRADYSGTPAEAFALYHALRDELFEVAGLGGAVQAVKDAITRAAAQASDPAGADAIRVKGATLYVRQAPSKATTQADPGGDAALEAAVLDFWAYWSNRDRIERQLRQVVRSLGGENVVCDPPAARRRPAAALIGGGFRAPGSPHRARRRARPRSPPAGPSGAV